MKAAGDYWFNRRPDGTYSAPTAALTDQARQLLVGGFTYRLPPDWHLKSVPGVPYKMAFGREQDGNPANISFQEVAFSGNLAEFESKTLKEVSATLALHGVTNFRVLAMSMFETDAKLVGLKAVAEAERPDGKIGRQVFYFFQRKDGKNIGIVCSVTDEGDTYDTQFDSIMKTFRVTE
jgi:hypothetical protein